MSSWAAKHCSHCMHSYCCAAGLLGGARDAEMLAAATAANAYLLQHQQQQQQSPSITPPGPYSTAAAAAAAAMMMLPPPSPLPVPVAPSPLSAAASDAPPPLSRVSPASSVDLGGLNPTRAHQHTGNAGRYVQTLADGWPHRLYLVRKKCPPPYNVELSTRPRKLQPRATSDFFSLYGPI